MTSYAEVAKICGKNAVHQSSALSPTEASTEGPGRCHQQVMELLYTDCLTLTHIHDMPTLSYIQTTQHTQLKHVLVQHVYHLPCTPPYIAHTHAHINTHTTTSPTTHIHTYFTQ